MVAKKQKMQTLALIHDFFEPFFKSIKTPLPVGMFGVEKSDRTVGNINKSITDRFYSKNKLKFEIIEPMILKSVEYPNTYSALKPPFLTPYFSGF